MTQSAHAITLCGSIETVTEYLGFAINSILYQRGIYPADSFQQVRKYGLPLMISTNAELNEYLACLLQQIALWLAQRQCRLVALLIVNPAVDAVLERWEFTVGEDDALTAMDDGPGQHHHYMRGGNRTDEETVRRGVQAVLRQITACMSFLPELTEPCAFDMVVYTSVDVANVPSETWEASGSRLVDGGSEVRLKPFTTSFHKVDTCVSFQER